MVQLHRLPADAQLRHAGGGSTVEWRLVYLLLLRIVGVGGPVGRRRQRKDWRRRWRCFRVRGTAWMEGVAVHRGAGGVNRLRHGAQRTSKVCACTA